MPEFLTFCGRTFGRDELELMRGIAAEFSALGVTEIARTVCELLDWKRPNGGLKNHECRQLLERLETQGMLRLPDLRKLGGRGPRRAGVSGPSCHPAPIECVASECEPLELILVEGKAESRRWREQMERHHYLGCRVPFGANLRYWVRNGNRELACLLWTSPAWRMKARDAWIGWSDEQRQRNLQSIVNNGRFLILPWVRVKGLTSKILALSARIVPRDWAAIWASSAAAGNTGGRDPLSRNLLPGRQLDPCWADHWARSYGSRAPKTRCGFQRHLHLSTKKTQKPPPPTRQTRPAVLS